MTSHIAIQKISDAFARECFADVAIPAGTALFVAGGVPTAFSCYRREEWHGDLYDWLHLPEKTRSELAKELYVVDRDSAAFLKRAVQSDCGSLYAFGAEGRVLAVLLSDGSRDNILGDICENDLRNAVSNYLSGIKVTQFNMATQFVRRLFRRDQSLTDFFEGYLSLLCDQWPHCLAGIYYYTDNTYRLRFVSGSLKFTDRMQGRVDPTAAAEWKEILAAGSHYKPIDLLPDEPVLLPTPPSYLVLVEGPKSPRTEFVTAVIVSGDIDQAAAENIINVATLASELDETQFATVSEINTLFGNLSSSLSSGVYMKGALKAIYGILSRQLDVRSLLLSDGGSQIWRVTGRGEERPIVEMVDSFDVPESTFSGDSSQGIRIVDSNSIEPPAANSSGTRIITRADLPIRNVDGSLGILEVGSCLPKDALDNARETLRASAEFLQLCLALSRIFSEGKVTVGDPSRLDSGSARQSLRVIQQIAEGHFHEIISELSMVLGQSELIARDAAPTAVALSEDQFFAAAHKISKAVDRITHKVETLREVTSFASGNARQSISARELMIKLPTIVEGYSRHVRDTRNVQVAVEIDPSGRVDFELSREAVADTVLPVVLEVMGQATTNGQLVMCLSGGPQARRLSMTFARQLIAPATLEKIMEQSLPTARFDRRDDFSGEVHCGKLTVRYRSIASDTLQIDYTVANPEPGRNREARHLPPSQRKS